MTSRADQGTGAALARATDGARSRLPLVLAVGAALAAVSASGAALGIALPTLSQDLALGQAQVTLTSTVGTVVTAAALLPLGLAADRLGRRRILLTGLVVFGVAEALTAAVSSPALLVAVRAVAALGAACVLPTSLAVLVAAYPRDQRAKAVAIWAAVGSASASAAGLVSGALATAVSWRTVPLLIGVLALALLVPVRRTVPATGGAAGGRPDLVGAGLALLGIGGLVVGINQAGDGGLSSSTAWGPLLLAGLCLTAFVRWEMRTPTPLLPVRAFADPVLRTGALLVALVTGSFGAFTFLATQYLQFGRGLYAFQAAASFAATDVGLLAVSPLLPPAVRALGIRWVGTLGASLVAAALLTLALTTGSAQTWPVLLSLAVLGAGFALAITPATTLIVSGLPRRQLNTASSLTYVNRDVGTAVGTAVVGAVLLAVYSASLTTGLAGADLGLDAGQQAQVATGIAAAGAVAEELGGAEGEEVGRAARAAFLDGFRVAASVAAALAAAAALLCALTAPRGITDTEDVDPLPAT